jgi:hypothetical protein
MAPLKQECSCPDSRWAAFNCGPQGDVIRIYNYVRLVRGGLN